MLMPINASLLTLIITPMFVPMLMLIIMPIMMPIMVPMRMPINTPMTLEMQQGRRGQRKSSCNAGECTGGRTFSYHDTS